MDGTQEMECLSAVPVVQVSLLCHALLVLALHARLANTRMRVQQLSIAARLAEKVNTLVRG